MSKGQVQLRKFSKEKKNRKKSRQTIKVTSHCRSYHTLSVLPHTVGVTTHYRSYHTMAKLPHTVEVSTNYHSYHTLSKLPKNIEVTKKYQSYHTHCRSYHTLPLANHATLSMLNNVRYKTSRVYAEICFVSQFPPK